MSCPTCKDPIFNKQSSTIPTPKCNGDCPEEVICTDKETYSDCVGVNVALDCVETDVNTSLTEVLQAIDTKLCENTESNCTVKVSANDTCCGFLESKLVAGTGISISVNNEGACESLTIATNPGTIVWNTINLNTTFFSTIPGYQVPQYSNPDALGRVWFRGSITGKPFGGVPIGGIENVSISLLPNNARPLASRTYFNGKSSGSNTISPQLIYESTGVLKIKNGTTAVFDNKGIFSFDGFVIETN